MQSNEEVIPYMVRTRDYYRALGYQKDYVWSNYDDVPFAPLSKPLNELCLGLVTTAHPPDLSNKDSKGIRRVWSGDTDPLPAHLNTDNLAWDRDSTHTDDVGTYLPIQAIQSAVQAGVVSRMSARFHGVPTEYSQRKTLEIDAPNVLKRLREDGAEAALICAL